MRTNSTSVKVNKPNPDIPDTNVKVQTHPRSERTFISASKKLNYCLEHSHDEVKEIWDFLKEKNRSGTNP